eukprot:gene31602-6797_t
MEDASVQAARIATKDEAFNEDEETLLAEPNVAAQHASFSAKEDMHLALDLMIQTQEEFEQMTATTENRTLAVEKANAEHIQRSRGVALQKQALTGADEGAERELHDPTTLEIVFHNLTVAVTDREIKRDKAILKDVWGKASPGRLLAIMGQSGAGKSTNLMRRASFLEISVPNAWNRSLEVVVRR